MAVRVPRCLAAAVLSPAACLEVQEPLGGSAALPQLLGVAWPPWALPSLSPPPTPQVRTPLIYVHSVEIGVSCVGSEAVIKNTLKSEVLLWFSLREKIGKFLVW